MFWCLLQLFKCFNHMGICPSVRTVRSNVDLLVKESDEALRQWKNNIELQAQQVINQSIN